MGVCNSVNNSHKNKKNFDKQDNTDSHINNEITNSEDKKDKNLNIVNINQEIIDRPEIVKRTFTSMYQSIDMNSLSLHIKHKKTKLFFFSNNPPQSSYSTETEFINLLTNISNTPTPTLSAQIISLPQRQWYKELLLLSTNLKSNRGGLDSMFFTKYLNAYTSLIEHFNWLTWAICVAKATQIAFDIEGSSTLWAKGFVYKNVFVREITEKRKIDLAKREIKAMRMLLFEYLQMIDSNKSSKENLLSNDLIFPLVSLCEYEGRAIVCSAVIDRKKEDVSFEGYNREDMQGSALMKRIKESNVVEINEEGYTKFIIVSTEGVIPNLLGENRKEDIHIRIYNDRNTITSTLSEYMQYSLRIKHDITYKGTYNDIKYKILKKCDNHSDRANNFVNEIIIKKDFNLLIDKSKLSTVDEEYFSINNHLNKTLAKASAIEHHGEAVMLYDIEKESVKVKYPLISSEVNFDDSYLTNSAFDCYIKKFVQMLEKVSDNVNSIDELNYYFEKYGINKCMKLLIVTLMKNERKVSKLLKVDIMTSIIKRYIYSVIDANSPLISYNTSPLEIKNKSLFISSIYNSISFIFNPSQSPSESMLSSLSSEIYFLILKTDLLSLSLFHTPCTISISLLLSSLIKASQSLPLQFLNSLEAKMNITISFDKKYDMSTSIDNFITSFAESDIKTASPRIKSIFPSLDISYYLFSKCIALSNDTLKFDTETSSVDQNSNQGHHTLLPTPINRSIIPNNYNIMDISRDMSRYIAKVKLDNENVTNINDVFEINADTPSISPQPKPKVNTSVTHGQRMKFWKNLSQSFSLQFPSTLYKLSYLSSNAKQKNFSILDKGDAIVDWKAMCDALMSNVIPISNDTLNAKMHYMIYYFIQSMYVENNFPNAKNAINILHEIITTQTISISSSLLGLYKLLEGINFEKNSFFNCEDSYTKAAVIFLSMYGDPRGRCGDRSLCLLVPLWKIGRYSAILDNYNTYLLEYLKELFHAEEFAKEVEEEENDLHVEEAKEKDKKIATSLIATKNYRTENYNEDEECDVKVDDNIERPSVYFNEKVAMKATNVIMMSNFDEDMIQKKNKGISFPSLSDTRNNYNDFFAGEKFFVFFVKMISPLLFNRSRLSREYLNEILFYTSSKNNKKRINTNFSLFFNEYFLDKFNFKKKIPNGIVISWGNNTHNETSHNNYRMLSLPRIIYKLSPFEINKISCGVEHNIVLSSSNEAFSWGQNEGGQCAFPPTLKIIANPTKIKSLSKENIIKVTCGVEHSLALTDKGSVYSWGKTQDGVLGYESKNESEYIPKTIPFFSTNSIFVKDISTGSLHNIAIDTTGSIYSWGSSLWGQLGLDKHIQSTATPTKIDMLSSVDKVSCGEGHSIALDSNGNVYSWGYGSSGQLGLGFCEHTIVSDSVKEKGITHIPTPTKLKIEATNEDIIDIKCGKTFSMFLTTNGELFACGVNSAYQLGIARNKNSNSISEKCFDFVTPVRLDVFLNMKVIKIACGESHCIAVVQENKVKTMWSWGNNKFGQLGLGTQDKKSKPRPLNYFLYYSNVDIEDVACGEYHSLCLLKNTNVDVDRHKENKKKQKEMIEIVKEKYN